MLHLKQKQYYSNLYDRRTVDKCRRIINRYAKMDLSDDKYEEYDEDELKRTRYKLAQLELYFLTGDRYLQKEETINEWMERDGAKDKKLKEATSPEQVTCDTCGADMICKDRTLDTGDARRVMFFFKCPNNHLPHKYVYSDGTVWSKDPELCPECNSELEEGSTEDDKKIITEYSCPNCSYGDTDTINLETGDPEEDPHFEEDRERFCLSEEAGEAYRTERENMEQLSELVAKWEDEKEHKEEKRRADAIERLTVPNIKDRMTEFFEDNGLKRVEFDDLQVDPRTTNLPFTVEDPEVTSDNGRQRSLDLKKKIIAELKDTSWRLMSDGISNKLGVLSGRLRVYEDDDEIYELVKRENN